MKKSTLYVLFGVVLVMAAWLIVLLFDTTAYAGYDDDLYVLSHVICGEAEGCSRDMKLSVGSVVLNRVSDSRFPNTISEVVFQQGQYACTWDGNYYREPSKETIEVAAELLENGPAIDESVVWQAEFPQGVGTYDIIGNMYFCY